MRRPIRLLAIVLALLASACGSADLSAVDVEAGGGANTVPLSSAPSTTDATTVPPASTTTTSPATTAPSSTPSTSPSTSPSSTTVPGERPGALVLAEETTTQPATSFRMSYRGEFGGFERFGAGAVVGFSMEAAMSEDGHTGEVTVDLSELVAVDPSIFGDDAFPTFAGVLTMRTIDDTTYVSSDLFAWMATIDTPWIGMVDGAMGSGPTLSSSAVDLGAVLAVLRALDPGAQDLGWIELDGVEVRHIRGTISAASLAAAGNAGFLEDMDPTGAGLLRADEFDLEVWIGADGIVRRMAFGVDDLSSVDPTAAPGSFFRMVLEVRDVGEPVDVVAPPADQVTWLEDLMAQWMAE